MIRKKQKYASHDHHRPSNLPLVLRRRLRVREQHLLFSNQLKSVLILPPPLIPSSSPAPDQVEIMGENGMRAAEVELDPHERLYEGDSSSSSWSSSDEEMINLQAATTSSSTTTTTSQQKKANFNQDQDQDHDDDDADADADADDNGGSYCINVDFEEEEEEDASQPFKPSIKIRKLDDESIHISTIVMKEVSLTSTLFGVLEEENLDIVFEHQYRTETKVAHNIQVRVQPGYDVDALEKKLRLWAQCTT